MKDKIYIVANDTGVTRMTKRYPALGRDEIGVAVTVNIPDSAFRSPVIGFSVDVPEEHVVQPKVDIIVDPAPQD